MEKIASFFLTGAVSLLKGPMLALLMWSVVISLVRHPHGRLAAVRVQKKLPPR